VYNQPDKQTKHGITITQQDKDRTNSDEFLNDSLIDLDLKILQQTGEIEQQNQCHFFGSHFYTKLERRTKETRSRNDFKAVHDDLKRWTTNVRLFEKRWIFVPINAHTHWSLAVIHNPAAAVKSALLEETPLKSCIIHMDSMNLHRSQPIYENLTKYLVEEYRVQNGAGCAVSEFSSNDIPLVSPKVPQQNNYSDCGVFLLKYAEYIFLHCDTDIRQKDIDERLKSFLPKEMFTHSDISKKRRDLAEKITDLENQLKKSI